MLPGVHLHVINNHNLIFYNYRLEKETAQSVSRTSQ